MHPKLKLQPADQLAQDLRQGSPQLLEKILAQEVQLAPDLDERPSTAINNWLKNAQTRRPQIIHELDSTCRHWLMAKLGLPVDTDFSVSMIECLNLIDLGPLKRCQVYLASNLPEWRSWLGRLRSLGHQDLEFHLLWMLARASDFLSEDQALRAIMLGTWYSLCDLNNVPDIRYASLGVTGLKKFDLADNNQRRINRENRTIAGARVLFHALCRNATVNDAKEIIAYLVEDFPNIGILDPGNPPGIFAAVETPKAATSSAKATNFTNALAGVVRSISPDVADTLLVQPASRDRTASPAQILSPPPGQTFGNFYLNQDTSPTHER